jgi:hypothetical protein
MKRIFLIVVVLSSLVWADFIRHGDIVTDTVTNLEWQDDAASASTITTWQGAIDSCEALTLGGYTDWRLPNIRELRSIINRSRENLSIDPIFVNAAADVYWSSTTYIRYTNHAWRIHFNGGYDDLNFKWSSFSVRCVRGL